MTAVSLTEKVVAEVSAESSIVRSVMVGGFETFTAPVIPLRLPALPIVTVLSAWPRCPVCPSFPGPRPYRCRFRS